MLSPSHQPEILLSMHMSSNRPEQFVTFLDRLESSADDPRRIEVMAHIDDGDEVMHRLTREQAATRRLRVVPVSLPREGGFYGLWRAFDPLLRATHPRAYFVVNVNDEMYFETQGWDTKLARYVGLFPDHLFRLRTSSHRFRNYYDYWEAGFANDTSAIMTKRWLEAGGGWCPCNGPDTFQQTVAFYFGWLHRFDAQRACREIAISDIAVGGSGASHGLTDEQVRMRQRGAIGPWFRLVSHAMQQEAARRAQLLHAHIWMSESAANYRIVDNSARRSIEVQDEGNGAVAQSFNYGLSRIRLALTNGIRRLRYGYYGGMGDPTVSRFIYFAGYLFLRHAWLDPLYHAYWYPYVFWVRDRSLAFAITRAFLLVTVAWPVRVLRRPSRVLALLSAAGRRRAG